MQRKVRKEHLVSDAVAAAYLLDSLGQLPGVEAFLFKQISAEARVVLQGQHEVLHARELVLPVFLDVLRARYRPLQIPSQHLRRAAGNAC